jgi:hypothetical protein
VTGGAFGAIMFVVVCLGARATRVRPVDAGFGIGISSGQVMPDRIALSGDNRTT